MSDEIFTWFTVAHYTVDPRCVLSDAVAELEKYGDVIDVYDEPGFSNTITLALDETFQSSSDTDELKANARWALPTTHWMLGVEIINVTRESDSLAIDLLQQAAIPARSLGDARCSADG